VRICAAVADPREGIAYAPRIRGFHRRFALRSLWISPALLLMTFQFDQHHRDHPENSKLVSARHLYSKDRLNSAHGFATCSECFSNSHSNTMRGNFGRPPSMKRSACSGFGRGFFRKLQFNRRFKVFVVDNNAIVAVGCNHWNFI